ncbi:MAG: hypothetical protein A2017_12260 [Lentisphaerae bacterium GWF2_44_16]|nr:MAG: hypothetical protein A2017_12260 [Lentisphaerae bacterium GWF2_44_16]
MSIYMGIDASTQGVKAVLIDAKAGDIIFTESINFGSDLPEYKSPNGFIEGNEPLVKHANPLMWIDGLELLMERLQKKGAPLSRVLALSGSGQQHGSVYLKSSFPDVLRKLSPEKKIAGQISGTLSRKTSPIWMDSSTGRECDEIKSAIGKRLQNDTGSPATERFTGPQIRKFWKNEKERYDETAAIHLVSSFLASLLCGENSPVDFGDGAGMNLLNLKTLKWDSEIVEATAPGLLRKLPPPVASCVRAGNLSPYFSKYGFKAGIPVTVWSGDNPNSLIGTGAAEAGIAVVSLGTSDTFFAAMPEAAVDPDGYGHVFGNPAGGFMSLICFKNGSLARENVRAEYGLEWKDVEDILKNKSIPGNGGNMMLPYFTSEITPLVLKPGPRFKGKEIEKSHPEAGVKIRAVMEGQALSMRLHSQWIGGGFSALRVTGGASRSNEFCRILANVFQARIEKISSADSAALGAAMRAANAEGGYSWKKLSAAFSVAVERINPDCSAKDIYDRMLSDFTAFEK